MQDVSVFIALASGLVSFFAPCVIPLIPAYVGYISGVSLNELRVDGVAKYKKELISSSVFYLLGFSTVFVILGTTAGALGSVFFRHSDTIQLLGGILIMGFALHFMGALSIPGFSTQLNISPPEWMKSFHGLRSFVVGMIFATAWTPCVGAVLGAILTLAAASQTAATGAVLLFVYSLGISIPFLLLSTLLIKTPGLLKKYEQHMEKIFKVAGGALFVIGFLLFNNAAEWFSPNLTYDNLNAWLFEMAYKFGYQIH